MRRASASASTRSSRSRAGAPATWSRVVGHGVGDLVGNGFARRGTRRQPPRWLRCRHRDRCRRARRQPVRAAAAGTSRRRAPRTRARARMRDRAARPRRLSRSGYVSANEIGTRMSGVPRCARSAPSRKRTSECTIEVGCTTTSILSYGMPKSQCASISSRPLLASVAESTLIFRPIDQVGWVSASLMVTSSSSARERPLKGPPEAVSTSACDRLWGAPFEALEHGGVLAVDGQQQATAAAMRCHRELTGGDEALLVRERERDAVLEGPQRCLDACEADDRVQHDVGLGGVEKSPAPSRRPARARRRARPPVSPSGCEPDINAHSSRSGLASTISIACRPIEPLAPSRATRFT